MLVLVVVAVTRLAAAAAAGPRYTGHSAGRHSPDPEGRRVAVLGCALCLAVADRINASLSEAHRSLERRRLTAAEVSAALEDACSNGFHGYELWPPPQKEDEDKKARAEGKRRIEHFGVSPPGYWMLRLRKECLWYVQEGEEEELYLQWRGMLAFPAQRLDLFLCRNSGWLRTCVNLSEDDLPTLHPPVVEATAVGVTSEMANYSITRFHLICTRMFCWRL